MRRNVLLFNLFLVGMICLIPGRSCAQFGYLGLTSNLSVTPLSPAGQSESTTYSQFAAGIDGSYRFRRNWAISGNINVTLGQRNSFTFRDARTTGHDFNGFSNADRNNYLSHLPEEMDYTVKMPYEMHLGLIYYFESSVNSFIELGLGFLKINESFTFIRKEKVYNIDGKFRTGHFIHIDEDFNYKVIVPNIGFGIQPHLSKSLYLKLGIRSSLLLFKDPNFSYAIYYKTNDVAFMESKFSGLKIKNSLSISLGVYI